MSAADTPAIPARAPDAAESVRTEVGNIPAIEGLRGVAVLWVMVFHFVVVRDGKLDDAFIAFLKGWPVLDVFARNGASNDALIALVYLAVIGGVLWAGFVGNHRRLDSRITSRLAAMRSGAATGRTTNNPTAGETTMQRRHFMASMAVAASAANAAPKLAIEGGRPVRKEPLVPLIPALESLNLGNRKFIYFFFQ